MNSLFLMSLILPFCYTVNGHYISFLKNSPKLYRLTESEEQLMQQDLLIAYEYRPKSHNNIPDNIESIDELDKELIRRKKDTEPKINLLLPEENKLNNEQHVQIKRDVDGVKVQDPDYMADEGSGDFDVKDEKSDAEKNVTTQEEKEPISTTPKNKQEGATPVDEHQQSVVTSEGSQSEKKYDASTAKNESKPVVSGEEHSSELESELELVNENTNQTADVSGDKNPKKDNVSTSTVESKPDALGEDKSEKKNDESTSTVKSETTAVVSGEIPTPKKEDTSPFSVDDGNNTAVTSSVDEEALSEADRIRKIGSSEYLSPSSHKSGVDTVQNDTENTLLVAGLMILMSVLIISCLIWGLRRRRRRGAITRENSIENGTELQEIASLLDENGKPKTNIVKHPVKEYSNIPMIDDDDISEVDSNTGNASSEDKNEPEPVVLTQAKLMQMPEPKSPIIINKTNE